MTIDGYPADENTGRPVCTVFLTCEGKHITSWTDPDYRTNALAREAVNEAIRILTENWKTKQTKAPLFDDSRPERCTVIVYPCIEFDDDTAVICRSITTHENIPSQLVRNICGLTAEYYEKTGKTPVKYYPVSKAAYEGFCEKYPDNQSTTLQWDENHAWVVQD